MCVLFYSFGEVLLFCCFVFQRAGAVLFPGISSPQEGLLPDGCMFTMEVFSVFFLANKKNCNKTVPGQKALPKSANQSYHIGILVQSNS